MADISCTTNPEELITIVFHGKIPPLLLCTNSSPALTCEKVIEKCIDYIRLKLYDSKSEIQIHGAKYLPTFGLVICPEEVIWIPLNRKFKNSTEKPRQYKFRVRFRPPAESFLDNIMCEYLFLQILEDFLKGPLGKNEKLESKTLFGLLHIALMIPTTLPLDNAELVNENFKSRNFNILNFTQCFSREITKRFISQPLVDHFWVYKTIKEEIHGFKKHNPPAPLGFYKKEFYKLLMEAVPDYCFEVYRETAVEAAGNNTVSIKLSLYKESNKQDGLYYGEDYQCSLNDIYAIRILKPKDLSDKKWIVEIDTYSTPPKIIIFDKEGAAESFASMIQGYYSLCVRYDICLCKELQTAGSVLSSQLKSFGPLGDHSAESFLEESKSISDLNNGGYLIHEHLNFLGHYGVVCRSDSKTNARQSGSVNIRKSSRFGSIECLEGTQLRLKMEGKETTFDNGKELRSHLNKELGTQVCPSPKNAPRVADINEEFQTDLEYYGSHTSNEDVQTISLPIIKSDLTDFKEIQDMNPLVKKYEVCFNTEQMMLVVLQSEKGEYAKAFREGLEKLLKLYRKNNNIFLKFYNLVIDAQFSVLMEYVPCQDVLSYICKNRLSVAQKLNIVEQIVKILQVIDREQIYHGNLRLRKFMTFQGSDFITVKLGDPGISSYFDTLPLNDPDNDERVPWLSPERRKNLQKITSESEVYAVGTTLCEILYRNDRFRDELKLPADRDMLTFLTNSQLPRPPLLSVEHNESNTDDAEGNALVPEARDVFENLWKIILRCWEENEYDRPTVPQLLEEVKDLKMQADAIQGDTVIDQFKLLAYDMGMKETDFKTDKLKELKKKFDKYFNTEYLDPVCVKVDYSKKLGKGHFGAVYEGHFRLPEKDLQATDQDRKNKKHPESTYAWKLAAVKRIKRFDVREDRRNLYKEVLVAFELNHPNIVKLLYLSSGNSTIPAEKDTKGFPIYYDNVMLIMEFMDKGNLAKYAQDYGELNNKSRVSHMLRILLDVAKGMAYLSGKSVVHRDLAARNILLCTGENERIIAKVSDFGLARMMEDNYRFYKLHAKEALPIAWLPPECLLTGDTVGKFSPLGDVWSFGTVMWESFSKGDTPWKHLNPKIGYPELLSKYEKGWRLPQNRFMTKPVSDLMMKCWDIDPKKRPPFVDLEQILEQLIHG